MRESLQAPGQIRPRPHARGSASQNRRQSGKTGKSLAADRQHLAALSAFPGNLRDFGLLPQNWHAHC
jgi:hypothetical protein